MRERCEQPPQNEDCLLYPQRCAECLRDRKECILNLFNDVEDGNRQNKKERSCHHYIHSGEIKDYKVLNLLETIDE